MNFRKPRAEDPEINLIPFIDVLLVVLIFLMLSTTYSKFTELQVSLPTAEAEKMRERPAEIIVAVSADARYLIDNTPLSFGSATSFGQALQQAAAGRPDVTLVINADAGASHQSVVNVLEAARLAGLAKVTFAAQSPASGAR